MNERNVITAVRHSLAFECSPSHHGHALGGEQSNHGKRRVLHANELPN